MNVKPIKNESDYDAALVEIADLMDARANTPEGDRLDVLVTLVEAYEERHWRDLEKVLGSKSRVSEVLNRKLPLTIEMIRRLQGKLGIPAESLIQAHGSDGGEAELPNARSNTSGWLWRPPRDFTGSESRVPPGRDRRLPCRPAPLTAGPYRSRQSNAEYTTPTWKRTSSPVSPLFASLKP